MLLRFAGPAVLVLLLAPLFMLAEHINPATAPEGRPDRHRRVIALALLQLVWVPTLGTGLAALAGAASLHGPLHDFLAVEGVPVRATEAFLFMDLAAYWMHRAEHGVSVLWRLHALHHSGGTARWTTSLRFHPLDVALQQGVPFAAAVLLGFGLPALVPYLAVASIVTLFAHVNTALPEGWWTRLVVTPGYHRAHHEAGGGSGRFAVVLPWLDTLFGTDVRTQRTTSSPAENDTAFAT